MKYRRTKYRKTVISILALVTSLVSFVQATASEDPWARFRSYREQLVSLTETGDSKGLAKLRREILETETALGVLLNLPGSDPAGAEGYYLRAVAIAEEADGKAQTAETFGDRIDVFQAYADFLADQDRGLEAEKWFGRSLREVEGKIDTWSQLRESDSRHEAVASLRDGRLPTLLRAAASVAATIGKAEIGLAYLDRADRLAKPASREETYPVLVTRARLLKALDREPEALATLTEALAIRLDPEVLESMGEGTELGVSAESLLVRAREMRTAAAFDFPAFRLRDAQSGQEVTFADVRGRATLFNVFFPSCGFCNAEMPHLKEIEKTYADRGFKLVSVNLLPDQDKMIPNWKERGGYQHPILVTESTDYLLETFGLRFPGGMPANFLIDTDGKVHFKHIGYRKGEEKVIEAQVRELLELPPLSSPGP